MTVDYGRGEGNVVIQGVIGAEVIQMKEVAKVDARQKLWDELTEKNIPFKKNMSKSKLENLLN